MFISVCFFRDLRGNKFECDCKAKWLFLWLKMTNSTVSDVLCIGPAEYQDKKLNDVTSLIMNAPLQVFRMRISKHTANG